MPIRSLLYFVCQWKHGRFVNSNKAVSLQEDYLHAKHMYNLGQIKNRKMKFGMGVISLVGLGASIPLVSSFSRFLSSIGRDQ